MVRSERFRSIVWVRKAFLASAATVWVGLVGTAAVADPPVNQGPMAPAREDTRSGVPVGITTQEPRQAESAVATDGGTAAVPSNDLCLNATGMSLPASLAGTTSGASLDTVPVCDVTATAPGAWFTVVGSGGTITATTCSQATHFDTKLSVFCGECGSLNCVVGNDNSATGLSACELKGLPAKSTVRWCSTAGVVYRILVHGFQGQFGDFVLTTYEDSTLCTGARSCPAPIYGACCDNYGGGCYLGDYNNCLANGRVFQGLGTSCYSGVCTGACCFESQGNCGEGYGEGLCIANGGTFHGGQSRCQDLSCGGACCNSNDGSCSVMTHNDCNNSGYGTFRGPGTNCQTADCPEPGACCINYDFGYACIFQTETACSSYGGQFRGEGSTCEGGACVGACCDENHGSCSIAAPQDCVGVDTFRGLGTSCETAECPPRGACCLSGYCDVLTESACSSNGGEFRGAGTTCEGGACEGACCDDFYGGCYGVSDRALCEGTFQGPGTNCGTADCPQAGACCFDFSCDYLTESACTSNLGKFAGVGTDCSACSGACCAFSSSACINTYGLLACEQQYDGVYQGNGSTCADAHECQNTLGACCVAVGGGGGGGGPPHPQPGVVGGGGTGACVDRVTAFECATYLGESFREGMDCTSAGCTEGHCPGSGECCTPHRSLGCNDAECCRTVCSVDPFCCLNAGSALPWDDVCINLANRLCGDGNGGYCAVHLADLNGDGIVDLLDYRLFQNSFGE